MNIKSLLAAVSIVALTSASAHAIELRKLSLDNTGLTFPWGAMDPIPDDEIESDFELPLAYELDMESTPVLGSLEMVIELSAGGNFPAGENLRVVVALPDGVVYQSGEVQGTDIFIDGGHVYDDDIYEVDIPVDGATTNPDTSQDVAGEVFGAVTSETAEFRIAIPNSPLTTERINLSLPVQMEECPEDGYVTVTVQDAEGEFIENDQNGARTLAFLPCQSAVDGTLTPHTDEKEVLLADGYTTIGDTELGTLTVAIDPTVALTAGQTEWRPSTGGTDIFVIDERTPPHTMDFEDIDTVEVTVSVEDATGLEGFDLVLPAPASTTLSETFATGANSVTFEVAGTSDNIDALAAGAVINVVDATGMADDEIITQNVTVDTTVNFRDTVETVPGATGTATPIDEVITRDYQLEANDDIDEDGEDTNVDGPIDTLDREGRVFGFFDWVGSSSTATITVLRVTGLPTDEDVAYTVEFKNANDGSDGSYRGVATAADLADGELALFSHTGFGTSNTNYTRADVQICFETDEEDVDVDRLMIRNNVVSAYNDGANREDTDSAEPGSDDDNN